MDFKFDNEFLHILAIRNGAVANTVGNKPQYNLQKLAEESSELGLVCLQKHMKPTKVKDVEVTDEIGDVLLRIRLYLEQRPDLVKAVQERINYKTKKYKEYRRDSLYAQI